MTPLSVSVQSQIKAFRNILIHAYDNIDHAIVWGAIQTKLPLVLTNVEQLLRNHNVDS